MISRNILLSFTIFLISGTTVPAMNSLFQTAVRRGLPEDGLLLVVDVSTQRLTMVDMGGVGKQFVVSTASAGVGNQYGSFRTPLGWHKIAEYHGGNERPGRVFVARIPQRQILSPGEFHSEKDADFVLTRIMWLKGLEPGYNSGGSVDTFKRTIYLHGTHQEQLLGQPSSKGCIRMSNRDVMELYDLTETRETWCLILEKFA